MEASEADDVRSFDDLSDAAAALTGIMSDDPEEDETDDEIDDADPEGEQPEDDAEVDEEDDEEDEPATPAIEPPASLTAEEKEAFAQLPPEAQRAMRDFAIRRDKEVSTGLEKARSAQRLAETSTAQKVAEAETLHADQLMAVARAYAPQPPSEELARHNPGEYLAADARYKAQLAQHNQFVQQVQALKDEAQANYSQAEEAALRMEWQQVAEDLPEARDPAQWQALLSDLTPVALALGYPEDQIPHASPTDIRAIKRVKAWKDGYDKLQALQSRKMEHVRSGKTAKANPAQPKGSGKAKALSNQRARLRQTGDVSDAAAVLNRLFSK